MPGLEEKEDVNITVHNNRLHLNRKIKQMGEQEDENVHRTERYYGQFSHIVPLPSAVDDTGAKALYRNAVLEVRFPKSQKQIGRQIDVDFH
ncbi:MAG: Hsp20/alpha crystallin family protein [Alicyclobacillus sp.]|nr:Hsp20/alpha crystallin family protein [Alicyclobacillus sp.]